MPNYQAFKNEWNGRRVDYDHVYAYQCVDLALQYAYEELGVNGPVSGNAIDYWNKTSAALLDKVDKIATTETQVGDIVVFKTLGYNGDPAGDKGDGHIGIVDHQDATGVWPLEQNALGDGTGQGRSAIGVYRAIPTSRIAGVLRPKPPTPPPAPAPVPSYVYERLSSPMNVRVKPNCNLWDLNYTGGYANAKSLAVLSTDPNNPTDFVAVGKATKQDIADHPVYFMSAESFGDADVTGVPAFNQGVNTVDIGPQPAPAPTPTPQPAPAAVATPTPVDGEKIEVKVVAPKPDAWKDSYSDVGKGDYVAAASVIIHDLEGIAEPIQLVKGQNVPVAGTFTGPDGIKYYRTVHGAEGFTDDQGVEHAPNWRGIPEESLTEDDAIYTFKDDLIDDFHELKGYVGNRQKAIIAAAKIHGDVSWIASRLKKTKGK